MPVTPVMLENRRQLQIMLANAQADSGKGSALREARAIGIAYVRDGDRGCAPGTTTATRIANAVQALELAVVAELRATVLAEALAAADAEIETLS